MRRTDLLALTPEVLALYANLGLVKRAQREVEAGQGPALEEADGLVIARARDGAVTRLAPDTPLKATTCTCGAAMCRHRLAAVLAYQALHGLAAVEAWDPAAFDDAALLTACGEAAIARAQALLLAPLTVGLVFGATPSARLPTATVQFVVPMKLAFARCDCALGHGCEHVALAVWAFRRAAGEAGAGERHGAIELGAAQKARPDALLVELEAAMARVVGRGLFEAGSGVDLETARARAEHAGLLWVVDALEDLERQRDAWERRSATFSLRVATGLVGEIVCRLRAARSGNLPAGLVLGSGEARETVTAELRLTPLGVRLRADGERRFAELYLADRDTRQTYVLAHEWPARDGVPAKNGHELGELYVSSRLTLNALARADLVARAATRKANGHIDLALARGLKSSALPGLVGWADLPKPILIDDLSAFERETRDALPALLGPRRVGTHVHVIKVARVVDLAYSRGEQVLSSLVEDPSGSRVLVRVAHRRVSEGAIDATAQALAAEPRFISGELTRAARGFVLEPLGILGARLTVPDLAPLAPRGAGPLPPAESDPVEGHGAPLAEALEQLAAHIERGVSAGLSALGPHEPLAARLEDLGLERVAAQVAKSGHAEGLLDLIVLHRALELVR